MPPKIPKKDELPEYVPPPRSKPVGRLVNNYETFVASMVVFDLPSMGPVMAKHGEGLTDPERLFNYAGRLVGHMPSQQQVAAPTDATRGQCEQMAQNYLEEALEILHKEQASRQGALYDAHDSNQLHTTPRTPTTPREPPGWTRLARDVMFNLGTPLARRARRQTPASKTNSCIGENFTGKVICTRLALRHLI